MRRPSRTLSRRYAAGIIALRPECDGHIRGYDNADEIFRQFGGAIIDSSIKEVGAKLN